MEATSVKTINVKFADSEKGQDVQIKNITRKWKEEMVSRTTLSENLTTYMLKLECDLFDVINRHRGAERIAFTKFYMFAKVVKEELEEYDGEHKALLETIKNTLDLLDVEKYDDDFINDNGGESNARFNNRVILLANNVKLLNLLAKDSFMMNKFVKAGNRIFGINN